MPIYEDGYLFYFFLRFLSVGYAQSDTLKGDKPYGIKSCKIVSKFFNGPQSGEKTIVFDNWGNNEYELIKTITDTIAMRKALAYMSDSMFQGAIPKEQHTLFIRTPTSIYNISLDQKIGYKQERTSLTSFLEMNDQGKKIVGRDTILGKPCEIALIDSSIRVWLWKGLILKKVLLQEVDGMKVEEHAIEIDENYEVKPDAFKVPKGIMIQ